MAWDFLTNRQPGRRGPCSAYRLSIYLGQNLICQGFSGRLEERGKEIEQERQQQQRIPARPSAEPSLAMHKTNCWHKVTQRTDQGLVGRQEESIPPSLHLSIDIPGSPLSASGFCNYNQTATSRPRSTDWRLGLTEMWRGLEMICVRACVCVCACLFFSLSLSLCLSAALLMCVCCLTISIDVCVFCAHLLLSVYWGFM